MRGIPLADRIRLALADPEFAKAIIHAPMVLTGVDGDIRERIIQAELERQFGAAELEDIATESAALDVVDAALEITNGQLLVEAGMSNAPPVAA